MLGLALILVEEKRLFAVLSLLRAAWRALLPVNFARTHRLKMNNHIPLIVKLIHFSLLTLLLGFVFINMENRWFLGLLGTALCIFGGDWLRDVILRRWFSGPKDGPDHREIPS
jgi:hypothetical protein